MIARRSTIRGALVGALLLALALVPTAPAAATTAAPAAAATSCPGATTSSARTLVFDIHGVVRRALLHLPPRATGARIPLLIALHGYGGNGPEFEHDTGFSTLADQHGFAVAYPTSRGSEWDIGGGDRDVDFIRAVIDRVEGDACIDSTRIYATGVSNGAGMAARAGCELSSRIAAVALVAGGYRSLPACDPDRPVSVLEMHGTADTTVPYSGAGPTHVGAVLPYMFLWAAHDGCHQPASKSIFAPHVLAYTWPNCTAGTSVVQLKMYGETHGLPNAVGPAVRSAGPSTLSATAVIWTFLSAHTLAPAPVSAELRRAPA